MNKKVLVVLSMAISISSTAMAANPFSDVPVGHWAYAAVAKLAAAGVVDGYPDGAFRGGRTMTRYEMAQIVAKALAKGTIGADDKLVSEFADELDNLGVRMAKLEKNADKVAITGEVQLSYANNSGGVFDGEEDKSESDLRTRIWFTGEVNDNWHYTAMLENHQYFQGKNESGDNDTDFQRAFLQGNIGVVGVKAGRYDEFLANGYIYDDQVDAVRATVPFGDAYLTAAYGKMANETHYGWMTETNTGVADTFWQAELGSTWGNLNMAASYLSADNVQTNGMDDDDHIWTVGADYTAGKFNVSAMYLKGDDDALADEYRNGDDDGYVIGLSYGGAESDKPGSWGIYANYYDQAATTAISHTMDGAWDAFEGYGFKGYKVGTNVTLAKNMIAELDYYDLKGKGGEHEDQHARTLWSQLVVTF
jgi:hypothetical protein